MIRHRRPKVRRAVRAARQRSGAPAAAVRTIGQQDTLRTLGPGAALRLGGYGPERTRHGPAPADGAVPPAAPARTGRHARDARAWSHDGTVLRKYWLPQRGKLMILPSGTGRHGCRQWAFSDIKSCLESPENRQCPEGDLP